MSTSKLILVVAMCNNRGIGIDGKLPWRIKGDMAFFKKITTETKDKLKTNAVIMGRKTWESIPEKFRPLPNRINIIISHTLSSVPAGVYVAKGLDEAISMLSSEDIAPKIEDIFIIGGASIYRLALESPYCHRIYLTKILADIKCDTHMPDLEMGAFQQIMCPEVDSNVQTENNYQYKFEVYEKV